MSWKVYPVVRDAHLYLGLFFAPFVAVFCVSVFVVVHGWLPEAGAGRVRVVEGVRLAEGVEGWPARARVLALQRALAAAGVEGEIGFVRHEVKARRLSMAVTAPGREAEVEIDLEKKTAVVEERETGVWDGLVYLHKAPGPHLVELRKNWWPMAVWAWLADGTVYGTLLLTLTGVYLWLAVKAERRAGWVAAGLGLVSFAGVVYAVVR